MKKVLIASTALAAGLLTTGAASASEKIKLDLGGFSKWWVVGAWQDSDFEKATQGTVAGQGSPNSVDVKGDNEIFFGGSTTLDNGLEVGINIELEAGGGVDTAGGQTTTGDLIDKSFVYISGGFGKVILGAEANGTVLLHVMAPDAASNTGSDGILTGGRGIARPAAITGQVTTEIDTDAESDKITYVTPTFYGLTLGATYAPNNTEDNQFVFGTGGVAQSPATNNAAAEIYGVGALYANTFGGVGVKVSAGYVTYDVASQTNNSQEWSLGTQLSYGNFTVGGSYRDIQQNQQGNIQNAAIANNSTDSSGYVWDAGIQYASGPYALSFIYFKSVAEGDIGSAAAAGRDEVDIYQVSGKYSLGAGVDVLASVGHVEYDNETQKTATADANHNKGWAVMTGLSLAF